MGKGLLMSLTFGTTPPSCEPAWDLHSVPPLYWPFAQAPAQSNAQRGPPLLVCAKTGNLISASAPYTLWPAHGHPPAPCHRAEGSLPAQTGEGSSCSESLRYLRVRRVWGRSLSSCPSPHPGALWGEVRTQKETGSWSHWPEPGPGQGSLHRPWMAAPNWFAACACPPTIFLGLNNFLFLKDKSYLVLIHKVNEVLG